MIPVSILIPAFNEAANIEACINSVSWSNDIVVVDSGSQDGSLALAQALGARVIPFAYVPGQAKKKNWALKNVKFTNDWILILDADERIPPALATEIHAAVSHPTTRVGYYINRRFFFLGRWIKHAGYFPSWNLRLLRRGFGQYESIPDPSYKGGDNEVHEHVLLDGPAGYLKTPMDHFAYPTIATFVEKHNRYSNWEAEVTRAYLGLTDHGERMAAHLRLRRRIKRLARRFPAPDLLRFIYHYLARLGFLDGREGYLFCRLLAEYEFLIWAKKIENANQRRRQLLSAHGPQRGVVLPPSGPL